jgi:hypothetical protein
MKSAIEQAILIFLTRNKKFKSSQNNARQNLRVIFKFRQNYTRQEYMRQYSVQIHQKNLLGMVGKTNVGGDFPLFGNFTQKDFFSQTRSFCEILNQRRKNPSVNVHFFFTFR